MQVHARARLAPKGRLFVIERVLEQGWSVTAAAEAAGVAASMRRIAPDNGRGAPNRGAPNLSVMAVPLRAMNTAM